MKGFGALDYIVVVVYLVVVASLGSSFYRKTTTHKEYFLGGKTMWWLPVGISIIAADLSAITVMGVPAWGYQHNLELIWVTIGYPLMVPLVVRVVTPFYTKLNLYTAYEYLEKRFNLHVRLLTSLLFQLLRALHVAIAIYAPALVISLVTGLPVWQCVIFMGLFTTLYTTLGGMKAVIWTDVIQFCMVTSGVALIIYTATSHVSGGASAVYETALNTGRLKFLNFSSDPKELTSFWACVIGGSVLSLAPLTTDQAILQRLFSTKSGRDCNRSVILQAILVVPTNLLLFFAGTALFAFYYYHPTRLAGLTNPDAVMPFFAIRELPAGISGLIVASIFAASMAVMSAGINALATATTVDFYQRLFRPSEIPQHYVVVGRIGTACWGLVATFLALFAKYLGALILAYNKMSSYISGPLLGIFLLGMVNKCATPNGSLIGAFLGLAAASFAGLFTDWSFFYLGAIGLIVTLFAGYLASLFTTPPPTNKIRGLVIGQ